MTSPPFSSGDKGESSVGDRDCSAVVLLFPLISLSKSEPCALFLAFRLTLSFPGCVTAPLYTISIFVLSVMASVVANYISKWLDRFKSDK